MQWFTRFALVCALALGPLAPCLPAPADAADTNGDRCVDVLDLQQAVAELLSSTSRTLSDVNGDGAVDILDVQRILAAASQTAPAEPEDATPPAPAVIPLPAPLAVSLPMADQLRLALLPVAAPSQPLPADTDPVPPYACLRLQDVISPHAPPHLAAVPSAGLSA